MVRPALVLGAGLGGLVAAEELRRLLPGSDRVVVVERNGSHHVPPSLLWHAGKIAYEKYWLYRRF